MSEIKVDQLSPRTASGTVTLGSSGDSLTIPSGVTLTNNGTASGFGKVLQVVSATKTDTFTTTSATLVDVTGLSVNITPSSTSSKILIMASVNGSGTNGSNRLQSALVRDSTLLFVGDSAGSRGQSSFEFYLPESNSIQNASIHHLDSPSSTSSLTYKIQIECGNSAATAYINRTQNDTDIATFFRYASSITAMEIAG